MLYRKERRVVNPIRHLLLIHFLVGSVEDFFNAEDYKYFGSGPWPCLNPVASHYKKDVVAECRVAKDYKLPVVVGTFSCNCGFVYSRRGSNKTDDDKYKIGRIKSFGHVWEAKLLDLAGKPLSYNAIARAMKADPKTVKKKISELTANFSKIGTVCDDSFIRTDVLKNYQEKLLEVLCQNPNLSRIQIRKLVPAVYIWLYRHARNWLEESLPKPLNIKTNSTKRVNWELRDREILALVSIRGV